MADEEINEVRRIRHEISARFGHDISKLVAHYQGLEKKLRESGKYRFADSKLSTEKKKPTRCRKGATQTSSSN